MAELDARKAGLEDHKQPQAYTDSLIDCGGLQDTNEKTEGEDDYV